MHKEGLHEIGLFSIPIDSAVGSSDSIEGIGEIELSFYVRGSKGDGIKIRLGFGRKHEAILSRAHIKLSSSQRNKEIWIRILYESDLGILSVCHNIFCVAQIWDIGVWCNSYEVGQLLPYINLQQKENVICLDFKAGGNKLRATIKTKNGVLYPFAASLCSLIIKHTSEAIVPSFGPLGIEKRGGINKKIW